MTEEVPHECRPRNCHVVKWPEFQGYGFNLHAEKGKAGQFIGKVDDDSPAEASGLREGDRIVEVNGVNIGNENHQQVVTRIKSGGDETTMLVVDTNSDNYYKEHKKVIKGDHPDVIFGSSNREVDHVQDVSTAPPKYFTLPEESDDPEPKPSVPEVAPVVAVNGVSGDHTHHHHPRQCHLKIWPTFQGYGFNLHAERDKPGQFIGLVDDNSPASSAGLKVNDRIVEVNCVNVQGESHVDVIARIKAVPNESKLLVLDREADLYFRERGVTASSSMPETEYIVSPDSEDALQPQIQQHDEESVRQELDAFQFSRGVIELDDLTADKHVSAADENVPLDNEQVSAADEQGDGQYAAVQELELPPPPAAMVDECEPTPPEEPVNGFMSVAPDPPPEPEYTVVTHEQVVEPPKPAVVQSAQSSAAMATTTNADALELNLSVAEMKERIKSKKRQDPRLNKISFEQKYNEFQRM